MYKLGLYDECGDIEVLDNASNKEEAKRKYEYLRSLYGCTIWIQKVEYINPDSLFN